MTPQAKVRLLFTHLLSVITIDHKKAFIIAILPYYSRIIWKDYYRKTAIVHISNI
jgi:hypothetical protein